jgi:type III secretion protein L
MQDQTTSALNALPKQPGIKIIRARDEAAWRDGYRFLEEAKAAYASERARGYEEGMAAAKQQAGKIVVEAALKVDHYLGSLEKDVARLAFDIVRRVLGEFGDAELVARAARSALADFRDAKSVRLRVHPSAEAHVRGALAGYIGEDPGKPLSIILETDEELDSQSCILSTDFAIVDATIKTQLDAIAEAMGLKASGAEK